MSLIEEDIINNSQPIIFVLTAKNQDKILGVYNNLSLGLKALYLADEASTLQVSYINSQSKAHINDTYSCMIGNFSFNNDNLIYSRNLTNQSEEIVDENTVLTDEDFHQIKSELDTIEKEQNKKNLNAYHEKAHEMVDKSIIEKFNQLSKLLMGRLIKLIENINENYDMNFEYDLLFECDDFYQEANQKLNGSTLAEKIAIIDKINVMKSKVNDEIITLIDLIKEFGDEEPTIFPEQNEFSEDEMESLMMDTDLFSDIMIHKNNHTNQPNQFGKILYGSPPPSPPKQIIETKIPLRKKDPSVKKTVGFSDEVQIHVYQVINNENQQND